ncbi:glucose PTS transporter subunit EIIB, partial [uncultured Haemophilus sp.]|uniref:glucose PTS transporter subunit EIIB n=1 Tax=uncultured Haemophilus sp. TaxID=237779 RepID=UPI0025D8B548
VYTSLTGAAAGTVIAGQDPLWFAWITDLINFKSSGNMTEYNNLLATVTPARFKVGQVILSTASLLGVALAMYKNVDPDKKKKYKSMFISIGLAVFLTGVSEPIEFLFMFISPVLYVVYAILTGLAFALADLINLRVHAFGAIELITRIPMLVNAGLVGDVINFIIACLAFFGINFGVFNFCIKKFKIPTPGRLGNYNDDDETSQASVTTAAGSSQANEIINLLGGAENIVDVDACMTRLRITVHNPDLVGDEASWKQAGAMGFIVKGSGIQAIYGPKADVLKSDIQDVLSSGIEIPKM